MTSRRLGYWSSVAILAVGIAYIIALGFGFARYGLSNPITDPLLAVMEVLTLLSVCPIVCVAVAAHDAASPDRKFLGVIGVVFATLFAGTTTAVHFVELTAGRQLGNTGIVWPSRAYAAELLAWDVFLGLALIAMAGTYEARSRRMVRRTATTCGVLCMIGTIGPIVGNMRLQLIGVFGYAVLLPALAFMLIRVFANPRLSSGGLTRS